MKSKLVSVLGPILFAVGLAACSHGDPTGATCPTGSTLTYASFGQQFMTTYCTTCHSSTAQSRHGAPGDVNFDTQAQIQSRKSDIDEAAAAGPSASNDWMPESDSTHPAPTAAEREMLGQWLACGAP